MAMRAHTRSPSTARSLAALAAIAALLAGCASGPQTVQLQVSGRAAAVSDRIAEEMRSQGFRQNAGGVWERRDDLPLDSEGGYRFVLQGPSGPGEYGVSCEVDEREAQPPAFLVAQAQFELAPAGERTDVEVATRFVLRTRGDRLWLCEAEPGVNAALARIVLETE